MTRFCRRTFLKKTAAIAITMIGAAFGLLKSRPARAAEWPRDAYAARTVNDALRNLYGTSRTTRSSAIKIHAPWRAENGAVVPVSASSDLPDVRAITILVDKNTRPLAAHINLTGAEPYFFINIKMRSTSNVHFVVNSGGKLYSARRYIKVTVGA